MHSTVSKVESIHLVLVELSTEHIDGFKLSLALLH